MTKEYIINQLENNNWDTTEIKLADGTHVYITPCGSGPRSSIRTIDDCEFFLINSDIADLSDDDLDVIAEKLTNINQLRDEDHEEKAKLRRYFDEHEKNGWDEASWGWYSDWHKDLYGYRPHGNVCGVYVDPHYTIWPF